MVGIEMSDLSEIGKPSAGTANAVYILYLLSIIFGVTSIIGVIIAYIYKSDAPPWLQSHYQFQIRTFWIGILYGIVSGLLIGVGIGVVLLIGVVIWFIVRCVKGMKQLSQNQEYPDPETWWL